jgi:hypothetical protein
MAITAAAVADEEVQKAEAAIEVPVKAMAVAAAVAVQAQVEAEEIVVATEAYVAKAAAKKASKVAVQAQVEAGVAVAKAEKQVEIAVAMQAARKASVMATASVREMATVVDKMEIEMEKEKTVQTKTVRTRPVRAEPIVEERVKRVREVITQVPKTRPTVSVAPTLGQRERRKPPPPPMETKSTARIRLQQVEQEVYEEVMVVEAAEMESHEWIGDPNSKAEALLRDYWVFWEANHSHSHSGGVGASVGMTFTTQKVRKPNFQEMSEKLLETFKMFWMANKVNKWNERATVNSVISSAAEAYQTKLKADASKAQQKKVLATKRRKEARERMVGIRQSGNAAIILKMERKPGASAASGVVTKEQKQVAFPVIESPTKKPQTALPSKAPKRDSLPAVAASPSPARTDPWCNWCKSWHARDDHPSGCSCGCCNRVAKYNYEMLAKDSDKPLHRRQSASIAVPRLDGSIGSIGTATPRRTSVGRRNRTARAQTPNIGKSKRTQLLGQSRSEPRGRQFKGILDWSVLEAGERGRTSPTRRPSVLQSVSSSPSSSPKMSTRAIEFPRSIESIEASPKGYTRAIADSPELNMEVEFDRSSADAAMYNIKWFRSFSEMAEEASGSVASLPNVLRNTQSRPFPNRSPYGSARSSNHSPSPTLPSAKSLLSPPPTFSAHNRHKVDKLNGLTQLSSAHDRHALS